MSGGEYHAFIGDKTFESRVVESAQHARNRYLITFSPSDRRRDCIPSEFVWLRITELE